MGTLTGAGDTALGTAGAGDSRGCGPGNSRSWGQKGQSPQDSSGCGPEDSREHIPGDSRDTSQGTAAPAPHQAVQLGDGALAAGLADVPDLDAALAAGVDVARGVADGDGAHHLAVAQRVDLPRVPRDARPRQRIVRERHRLHLPIRADVERVRPAGRERVRDTGEGRGINTMEGEERLTPTMRWGFRRVRNSSDNGIAQTMADVCKDQMQRRFVINGARTHKQHEGAK